MPNFSVSTLIDENCLTEVNETSQHRDKELHNPILLESNNHYNEGDVKHTFKNQTLNPIYQPNYTSILNNINHFTNTPNISLCQGAIDSPSSEFLLKNGTSISVTDDDTNKPINLTLPIKQSYTPIIDDSQFTSNEEQQSNIPYNGLFMEVNEYLLQISPAAYFFSHWFKHLLSTLNPCQSTNTENILNDTHKEIHNDGTDSNKTCITDNYTEVSKYYRNIQEQDRNLLITQRRNMQHRAVFSEVQRRGLESAFRKHAYITKPDRKLLAERLGLRDVQVKIWFQNRRMKWRNLRQNCRNTPVNSNQSEQKRKSTKKSEKRSDISMSIVNSSRHSINLDIIPQNPDIDISNQLSQMHTSVVPCLLMKDKLNEIKSTEK